MRDLRALIWAPGARVMLVAVAVALFGLMSMHGWGSHTGGHIMAMAPANGAISTEASHAPDRGHATKTHDGLERAGAQTADAADGRDEPDGGSGAALLEICLGVLAGLLLGVALLFARRGLRLPQWLLPGWTHPVLIGREREPPDPLHLCVIRC